METDRSPFFTASSTMVWASCHEVMKIFYSMARSPYLATLQVMTSLYGRPSIHLQSSCHSSSLWLRRCW